MADPAVPTLAAVSGKAVTDWLKPTGAKPLEFKTAGVQPGEITFVPLYQVNDQRYSVYWDAAAPAVASPTA